MCRIEGYDNRRQDRRDGWTVMMILPMYVPAIEIDNRISRTQVRIRPFFRRVVCRRLEVHSLRREDDLADEDSSQSIFLLQIFSNGNSLVMQQVSAPSSVLSGQKKEHGEYGKVCILRVYLCRFQFDICVFSAIRRNRDMVK